MNENDILNPLPERRRNADDMGIPLVRSLDAENFCPHGVSWTESCHFCETGQQPRPVFSTDVLKRSVLTPEQAAAFKATARRLVYYVQEDGRMLLAGESLPPHSPHFNVQTASEEIKSIVKCQIYRHVATTQGNRDWIVKDIGERIDDILTKHLHGREETKSL